MNRRALLRGTCALAAVYGCGRRLSPDTAGGDTARPLPDTAPAACADDAEPGGEGWVAVDMAEHPALYEPGGHAYISVPEAFLQATVLHLPDGCFTAVWRICTHGACETEWVPDEAVLECPCHGSRFDTDGTIRVGPATVPLRTFEAVRRGDTVWIWRPT